LTDERCHRPATIAPPSFGSIPVDRREMLNVADVTARPGWDLEVAESHRPSSVAFVA
jgi:hypothetical protein